MAIINYLQIFGSLAKHEQISVLNWRKYFTIRQGIELRPPGEYSMYHWTLGPLKLNTAIHSEALDNGKIPKSANNQSSDPQRMMTDVPESIRLYKL